MGFFDNPLEDKIAHGIDIVKENLTKEKVSRCEINFSEINFSENEFYLLIVCLFF